MKVTLLLMTMTLILAGSNIGAAQTGDVLHTPKRSGAERQLILDALRSRGDMIFKVDYLKVHRGWAWIDATPLDARTKKATAEGGPFLLHMESGKWKIVDLSVVPDDPNNPMGAEDLSKVYLANLRKIFPEAPLDIFPKPRF